MLEKRIESRLVEIVRKHGGLCFKWVSPGTTGVPDRIVITPNGRVHFVELKRPSGGRLSDRQKFIHEQLVSRGIDVWILWSLEEVGIFAKEVFAT